MKPPFLFLLAAALLLFHVQSRDKNQPALASVLANQTLRTPTDVAELKKAPPAYNYRITEDRFVFWPIPIAESGVLTHVIVASEQMTGTNVIVYRLEEEATRKEDFGMTTAPAFKVGTVLQSTKRTTNVASGPAILTGQ
jgi:hypothetical protein